MDTSAEAVTELATPEVDGSYKVELYESVAVVERLVGVGSKTGLSVSVAADCVHVPLGVDSETVDVALFPLFGCCSLPSSGSEDE